MRYTIPETSFTGHGTQEEIPTEVNGVRLRIVDFRSKTNQPTRGVEISTDEDYLENPIWRPLAEDDLRVVVESLANYTRKLQETYQTHYDYDSSTTPGTDNDDADDDLPF